MALAGIGGWIESLITTGAMLFVDCYVAMWYVILICFVIGDIPVAV